MFAVVFALALSHDVRAETLATVGATKITVEEFKARRDELRDKVLVMPKDEDFLEDLIRYKIGLQEAAAQKLAQDPVVRERFDQVLYNSLLEKELGPKIEKVTVSDGEMKTFYKANPELHLSHILISVKTDATTEEREIARTRGIQNLDEVRASKRPFEELVKLYSDDTSTKENGGDLGYQTRVTLLPDIYDIAVKMKIGEVKGLIESKDGFHILKLLDRRTYDLADKRQVRSAVIDQTRAKLFDEYFAKLKKQKVYHVDLNKEALRSLH